MRRRRGRLRRQSASRPPHARWAATAASLRPKRGSKRGSRRRRSGQASGNGVDRMACPCVEARVLPTHPGAFLPAIPEEQEPPWWRRVLPSLSPPLHRRQPRLLPRARRRGNGRGHLLAPAGASALVHAGCGHAGPRSAREAYLLALAGRRPGRSHDRLGPAPPPHGLALRGRFLFRPLRPRPLPRPSARRLPLQGGGSVGCRSPGRESPQLEGQSAAAWQASSAT